MKKDDKIFVAGHRGRVGSAVLRCLRSKGYEKIMTQLRGTLNLTVQESVQNYIWSNKPDVVIDAAAMVGGIHANNTYRADFIYNNLQIQNNLINAAYENEVRKFLFLGSVCIYTKFTDQ